MSIEIRAKIICDTCGRWVEGPVMTNPTLGMQTYYAAKRQAMRERWMIEIRGGKYNHTCNYCSDGVRSDSKRLATR